MTMMAFVTNDRLSGQGLAASLSEPFRRIRAELRARRVYVQTLRQLRALSSRERADLGIAQTMITRLAAEAAWGKKTNS